MKELDVITARESEKIKNYKPQWKYNADVDLNNDGISDMVISRFGGYGSGPCLGRYLIADKSGTFSDQGASMGLPADGTPQYVGDLSGDAADDVVVIAAGSAGLYLNDGKGQFTHKPGPLADYLKKRGPYNHRFHIADLNNDGLPDLIISGRRLDNFVVFENRGSGDFAKVLGGGAWIDGVAVRDMDNDGLLDLCIGCGKDPRIDVYLNKTPNAGNYADICPRMDKPNWAAVDAMVEAFKAGDLGREGAKPFWAEKAHSDSTPIHIGLGAARTVDLRVTFPGKEAKAVEFKALADSKQWKTMPDGKAEEMK